MNPFVEFRPSRPGRFQVSFPDNDPSKGVVASAIVGIQDPREFARAFFAALQGDKKAVGFVDGQNEACLTITEGEVLAELDLPDGTEDFAVPWNVFSSVLEDWIQAWSDAQVAKAGT